MHTPTPITSICVSIYQDFCLSHPIALFPLCRFIFFMIFDKCTSWFYWIWGKTSMPKQFFTSLIFKRSPKTDSTQKSCVFYKHIKINSLQTKGLQHKCRGGVSAASGYQHEKEQKIIFLHLKNVYLNNLDFSFTLGFFWSYCQCLYTQQNFFYVSVFCTFFSSFSVDYNFILYFYTEKYLFCRQCIIFVFLVIFFQLFPFNMAIWLIVTFDLSWWGTSFEYSFFLLLGHKNCSFLIWDPLYN